MRDFRKIPTPIPYGETPPVEYIYFWEDFVSAQIIAAGTKGGWIVKNQEECDHPAKSLNGPIGGTYKGRYFCDKCGSKLEAA
jgi:hypothetical protein